MSNYTKGPWGVEISHDIAWVGQLRATSGFNNIICHTVIDRDYKQDVKDRILCDAKLIAAAPELLEACQWMYIELQSLNMNMQDERIFVQLNGVNEIIQKATT